MPSINAWAEEELGQAHFGDVRLNKRFVRLVSDLLAHPEATVPQACGDLAATKAAYRFWSHPQVSAQGIRATHAAKTAERIEANSSVLAIQDTTKLSLKGHLKAEGLGPIDAHGTRGLHVHSVMAVSPSGVPLGLLHQQVWAREAGKTGKKARRKQVPISQKESFRWLQSLEATEQAVGTASHIITVADGEADIYDLFATPRSPRMDLLIRASYDRRVGGPGSTEHLWASLQAQACAGSHTIHLEHKPGQKERDVTLSIRFMPIVIEPHAPMWIHPITTPIALWAVMAREEEPTEGQEPLCWVLLTSLPVRTLAEAVQCVEYYRLRWLIERYHFVLKSGCRVEDLQLETAQRLECALATYCIVAWRLLWLTYEAREHPEQSCETVLQPHQWQALYAAVHQTAQVPDTPPTLQQAVRWMAKLGGFLGRASDGEPGVQTIWRGLRRLDDLATMWLLLHPSPPDELTYG